jgi:hypothetical membrane protein
MRDRIRLGAFFWLASVEFFLAQLVAQLAAPSHDLFLHDISLLGISACGVFEVATSGSLDPVCSPLYPVFNLGIVLHGILVILGIWLTRTVWRPDPMTSLALVLLAMGGAGAIMVGAYPVDDNMLLHILGAVTAIAAPGLGFVLLARSHWTRNPRLARWTLLAGLIVLLAGLGHALGGQPLGRGTMERLAVWPQTLWFAAVGAMLLATTAGSGVSNVYGAFRPPLWRPRTGAARRATIDRSHV